MKTVSRPAVPEKLWQQWIVSARERGLIRRGERILAAVSGGTDSVALLVLLHHSIVPLDISVAAAHYDHGLRGKESEGDADFVRDLGRALDIPVIVGSATTEDGLSYKRAGLEAAARQARYAFLASAAASAGADKIATGHTADDQAETFLIRLLRGSGGRGLRGILPWREDQVIRPLLNTRRSALRTFLAGRRIPFRTDSTNADRRFLRNRVREEVLPLLEEINPSIVETLCRQARFLGRDEASLSALAEEFVRGLGWGAVGPFGLTIPMDRFGGLPESIRHRVLARAIEWIAGKRGEGGMLRQDEALAKIASGRTGRQIWLGGGIMVEKGYDSLRVVKISRTTTPITATEVPLVGAMSHPLLPGDLTTRVTDRLDGSRAGDPMTAQFDLDRLPLPLMLRLRRRGDVLCPAGMQGHRKRLSDLMAEMKIPRSVRDSIPVLATPAGVIWLVGRRVDGRFLANAESRRVLVVSVGGEGAHV